jgi:site-specific recombinase XerD
MEVLPLFETLYRRQFTVRLQEAAVFAESRFHYLEHLAKRGHALATIRNAARDILAVAERIKIAAPAKATVADVEAAVDQWMQSRQRTLPGVRIGMVNNAKGWLRFAGLFAEPERSQLFPAQMERFERYMRDERGLASETISSRLATVQSFLSWFHKVKPVFSGVELADVDQYLAAKGREVWKRRTVATNAQTLRAFFRYAEQQDWCRTGIAAGIDLPRVYRMENVPLGPSWEQVRELVASTVGDTPRDLRDRAAMLLFAIYGLRCSEVRQLRLEDINWEHETVTVRRAKCRKTQTVPLTREVGDAIIRYIREARPKCECREIFITLKAPWRSVSQAGFYDGIRDRLDRLGIDLAHRGPHALRHACATKLLEEGFSMKEIGDHLGHASTDATRIYAKVDMTGLKAVADFDLGVLR